MDQPVNPERPVRHSGGCRQPWGGAGVHTGPAGTARFAGINASPRVLRLLGLADLALALALYIGRPSWP
jgi:hypothetical protein